MENNLEVIDNGIPAIGDSTLLALAEQAEKRVNALNKIKRAALLATNARDWTDQNGNPYLQVSGSEKVGRVFGIAWKIDEPVFEQEESGHFSYTYKGYFTVAGATIEAIGTRSSKDGFFKRYAGKGEDRKELPPSEIDKGDLKKAAYTNCIGNGITRLLGLRNLTWADLEEFAGIKKDQVGRVDYKKNGKTEEGNNQSDKSKITDAQRKRFYAIAKGANKSDDEIKKHLKEVIGSESTNDIPKDKYEELCAWAENKDRDPGEEG
jgi:hypothetical protein